MAIIEQTWTQFPAARFAQDELAEHLPRWLDAPKLPLARQIFRRSAVATRHMVLGPEALLARGRTFAAKNAIYRAAIAAEVRALCRAARASDGGRRLAGVDLLVTASCTGLQIPAMDALVVRELGLSRELRRVNLTQHGCAAGAAAIGFAHEWLRASPASRALVVCAELCSLAFQPEDTTEENVVSAAIFGDGAAAVLLAGDEVEAPRAALAPHVRLAVRATHRELFEGTEHFMGFDVNEAGLKIRLSRDVVHFAKRELPALFARACDRFRVAGPGALAFGAIHPGGRRILEVLEDDVGVTRAVTEPSWACLRERGNLSSASVLVVLDRLLGASRPIRAGDAGILCAFGPGFGAEMALLAAEAG